MKGENYVTTEERIYNHPSKGQKTLIRKGILQVHFNRNDSIAFNIARKLIKDIFPKDEGKGIASDHYLDNYVTAWKEGMWRTSEQPFKIPIFYI